MYRAKCVVLVCQVSSRSAHQEPRYRVDNSVCLEINCGLFNSSPCITRASDKSENFSNCRRKLCGVVSKVSSRSLPQELSYRLQHLRSLFNWYLYTMRVKKLPEWQLSNVFVTPVICQKITIWQISFQICDSLLHTSTVKKTIICYKIWAFFAHLTAVRFGFVYESTVKQTKNSIDRKSPDLKTL